MNEVTALAGKVVLMTGGASLICTALAERVMADGGRAVLLDSNDGVRAEVESLLGDSGLYLTGDVTDDLFLDNAVTAAVDAYGRIDGLLHAAAIFDDDLYETERQDWHRALDVNLVSAAMLTQRVIPFMKEGGGGAVVYVASISAHRAQPRRMVYSVTKAALLMLAKTGATQLAPYGIRVNTISPGWTYSRNLEVRYGGRARADEFAAEFQTMGRMADPEEIAAGIAFLLGDDARFVTGTDLAVDGGYTALGPEALGQAAAKVPPLV